MPLPLRSNEKKVISDWVSDMKLNEIGSSKDFKIMKVKDNEYLEVGGENIGKEILMVVSQ